MYSELWEFSPHPSLSLSVLLMCMCVCMCVKCVGGCAFSMCVSCITEWEDVEAHKGVQVMHLMNEFVDCVHAYVLNISPRAPQL